MSVLYGQEGVRFRIALRTAPVAGQFEERRARRYLFQRIPLPGIIDIPADPAFETCVVTQPCTVVAVGMRRHANSDQ